MNAVLMKMNNLGRWSLLDSLLMGRSSRRDSFWYFGRSRFDLAQQVEAGCS